MLHNCRNAGATRGHPYPKIMLTFMLVLRYWRVSNFCAYHMMKNNMAMFNEELGELTFSILARSVLADHTRDDFDHMDRLFRLLRVYRDVKSDVVADNSSSANTLNWRHKINKEGDEVTSTQLFFKKIIKQMVNGTYKSYDGTPKCYSNAQSGSELRIKSNSPVVYMQLPELTIYLQTLLASIKVDMNTNFLYQYSHIWPECLSQEDVHENQDVVIVVGSGDVQDEEEVVDQDDNMELENKQDVSEEDNSAEKDDNEQQNDDEENDEGVDPDHGVNPLDERDWSAWGTINPQNTMVGKRKTSQPKRFVYDKRRQGGHYPDPNV